MLINISDLKEYLFCPRIIYWYYCCPVNYTLSFKMKWGKEQHVIEEEHELRRNLSKYKLDTGEKIFGMEVNNEILTGKLDLLIKSENKLYPVEYKFTQASQYLGHYVQLYAYALTLQDMFETKVNMGYLYYPRLKEIAEVKINLENLGLTKQIAQDILKLIEKGIFPEVKINLNKCNSCKFSLFCNDVL